MCYKLPYGETKFDHNISKYTTEYILNLDPYGQHLFVFLVDIHYPKKLHNRDLEFPILCEQSIPLNDKVEKLMSTFYDKKNYTISIYMLKYCLKKGLTLKTMHYVIYTEQFDFMKPYIFLDNEKRNECSINKDKIGVQLFKCMSNSYFGKQIGK